MNCTAKNSPLDIIWMLFSLFHNTWICINLFFFSSQISFFFAIMKSYFNNRESTLKKISLPCWCDNRLTRTTKHSRIWVKHRPMALYVGVSKCLNCMSHLLAFVIFCATMCWLSTRCITGKILHRQSSALRRVSESNSNDTPSSSKISFSKPQKDKRLQ